MGVLIMRDRLQLGEAFSERWPRKFLAVKHFYNGYENLIQMPKQHYSFVSQKNVILLNVSLSILPPNVLLSGILLNVILPNVILQNVIMLNVILLNISLSSLPQLSC